MPNTDIIFKDLNSKDRPFFSYPSTHAALRIRQRTSMLPHELMHFLDLNICIDITQEYGTYGTHKKHLLFYSPKDYFYYVAIQDGLSGKVITVLHLGFHKTLAWPVTDEQCKAARQVYFDYISQLKQEMSTVKSESNINQNLNYQQAKNKVENDRKFKEITNFKRTYKVLVNALYICEEGQAKRRTLFKLSVDYYINDFEKSIKQLLCNNIEITKRIDHHIRRKRLFHETIYRLVFENKKDRNESYIFDFRPWWEAQEHAAHYAKQRKIMNQWLSSYQTKCLALPVPSSIKLLRLWY